MSYSRSSCSIFSFPFSSSAFLSLLHLGHASMSSNSLSNITLPILLSLEDNGIYGEITAFGTHSASRTGTVFTPQGTCNARPDFLPHTLHPDARRVYYEAPAKLSRDFHPPLL